MLVSPSGSALRAPDCAEILEGPSIGEVWQAFHEALQRADGWFHTEEGVPARPLLPPDEWPEGTDLVVEVKKAGTSEAYPCKLCSFGALCGFEERR